MSESFIHHFISITAALICLLVFFAGYKSGQMGWWWPSLGCIVIYFAVYKIIDVG